MDKGKNDVEQLRRAIVDMVNKINNYYVLHRVWFILALAFNRQ